MAYFKKFQKVPYDLYGTYDYTLLTNILTRVKMLDAIKTNGDYYIEYEVKDTDSPEIISNKIYGSPEHFWIVLLMNDIIDPLYGWVLDDQTIENALMDMYPGQMWFLKGIEGSFSTTSQIVDKSGTYYADVLSYDATYRRLHIQNPTRLFTTGTQIRDLNNSNNKAIIGRVVQRAYDGLHHFEKDGVWISPRPSTFTNIDYITGYAEDTANIVIESAVITNSQHFINQNELKRKIKLIRPELLGIVLENFDNLVS